MSSEASFASERHFSQEQIASDTSLQTYLHVAKLPWLQFAAVVLDVTFQSTESSAVCL